MQRQRGPFAVARQTRRVALGEEPFKSTQGARERLTLHQVERLTQ
jgi:hypothetical protein